MPYLKEQGIDFKVTLKPVSLIGGGRYYPMPDMQFLSEVETLTSGDEFDLVIIGNNFGQGVPQAAMVADKLKDKTLVVWNNYRKGDETPYLPTRIKHFDSRDNIQSAICRVLDIKMEQ
jgi:hypothetical protein